MADVVVGEFRCPGGSCASASSWRCIYMLLLASGFLLACSCASYGTSVSRSDGERQVWGVVDGRKRRGHIERFGAGRASSGFRGRNAPDGVTSSQTDPLRNRAVLLLGLSKLLLGTESLVALFEGTCQQSISRSRSSERR